MDHLGHLLVTHIRKYVPLSSEQEEKVLPSFRQRRIAKRGYLIKPGEVCRYESFVIKGSLRSFITDEQEHEHVLQLAVEEAWVSDFNSFLYGTPAQFYIEAVEPSVLLQIERPDLEALYRQVPPLERYFRLLHQNLYLKLSQRIVDNLSLSARDRYINFIQQAPGVAARFPQKHLASYLGMTPVALSLIRKGLKDEAGPGEGNLSFD
ncbi:MAG: Crp/Fnr family transcriptional regulator [Chitinophagaceae bacterium]|nr:Crp/Fnr family transcriptional regulator [Chitinophagaceae bacterium]